MLDKKNNSELSIVRRFWWQGCALLCRIWMLISYRYRSHNRHYLKQAWQMAAAIDAKRDAEDIAKNGKTGVLYLSNHQSMLDPILVGLALRYAFFAMARQTLWRSKALGWMMDTLNAIPVNQARMDKTTMKQCADVLKAGRKSGGLLIFPEGERTFEGPVGECKAGSLLMIRRSNPVVLPMAIDGAYKAWPRQRKKPHLFGRIQVAFGEPQTLDSWKDMSTEEILLKWQVDLEALRLGLKQ